MSKKILSMLMLCVMLCVVLNSNALVVEACTNKKSSVSKDVVNVYSNNKSGALSKEIEVATIGGGCHCKNKIKVNSDFTGGKTVYECVCKCPKIKVNSDFTDDEIVYECTCKGAKIKTLK